MTGETYLNTLTLQQLPALVLPLAQFLVAALPPGLPPAVTFAANTAVQVLQMFASQAGLQAEPHRPLAMPAHLPDLPPRDQWTPEGVRAWAERHAG